MAIFGAKDEDIHILTQFYQLEFDPEKPFRSEVDEWIYRYRHKFFGPGEGRYASEQWKPPTGRGEAVVMQVAPLHPIVCRLMDFMARDDDFREAETKLINDLTSEDFGTMDLNDQFRKDVEVINKEAETIHTRLVPWNLYLQGVDVNHPVLTRYSPYADKDASTWSMTEDKAIVVALIENLPKGRKAFRRCSTCSSVFVVGRSDQQRCSKR